MSQGPSSSGDPDLPIHTQRLVLRPVARHDADFIVELMNDEAFLRFIGDRNIRTTQQAAAYIQTTVDDSDQSVNRLFAVTLAADLRVIGICSFLKRDQLEFPDIGFAFLPAFRGHGFAFEATQATLDYVLRQKLADQVVAVASPENEKSISLLTRLGFRRYGWVRMGKEGPESALFLLDQPTGGPDSG